MTEEEIFNLLATIADIAKVETQLSIDRVVEIMVQRGSLASMVLHNSSLHNQARCTVFFLIGHMFLLYPAAALYAEDAFNTLAIDGSQAACFKEALPIANSECSIGENLRTYGLLLPTSVEETYNFDYPDLTISKDLLYIALLNASTLVTVGGISILWVNNISSHLAFDAEKQELMIFSLPSFCEIVKSNELPLSRFVLLLTREITSIK